MKQLRLPFLFLFLSLILLGCENKIDIERNSSATPFKVNQETGYVMYREEIKDWCISLNIPDNIDSYVYFYDKDMKDSLKRRDCSLSLVVRPWNQRSSLLSPCAVWNIIV